MSAARRSRLLPNLLHFGIIFSRKRKIACLLKIYDTKRDVSFCQMGRTGPVRSQAGAGGFGRRPSPASPEVEGTQTRRADEGPRGDGQDGRVQGRGRRPAARPPTTWVSMAALLRTPRLRRVRGGGAEAGPPLIGTERRRSGSAGGGRAGRGEALPRAAGGRGTAHPGGRRSVGFWPCGPRCP